MPTIKVRLQMPTSQQYAKALTKEKIEKKISTLKNLNLKEVDDVTLRLAINDVISYKPEPNIGHSVVSMMATDRILNKGTNLYRVRICDTNPLETMIIENDAWNPPEKVVKMGRVNELGESLLYVAEDMETAIKEMKIKSNQYFWLIVYELKKDIRVVNIGHRTILENEFTPIHNKVADFLNEEFTRVVKKEEEYEYRVSNMIAKVFYPLNNSFDGWSYPSVANKGLYSICLEPKIARKKMKIINTLNYLMKTDADLQLEYIGCLNKVRRFIHEKIEAM